MKTKLLLIIILLLGSAGAWADGPVTTAGSVTTSGEIGSSVTVPITVTCCKRVGAISLKLAFDPAILNFYDIEIPQGSPDVLANGVISGTPPKGMAIISWIFDPLSQPVGISLPDESILVNLVFRVVSYGSTKLDWTDDDGGNGCEYMELPSQDPFGDVPTETHYRNGFVKCQSQSDINTYTILGFSQVKLSASNFVQSGSVGARAIDGSVEIGANSTVNGPGAFIKAKAIYTHPSVALLQKIFAPADVTLPPMQWNSSSTAGLRNLNVSKNSTVSLSGNYKDVNIADNCVVTFIDGTIFGNINIGKSSRVIFMANTLNMQRLDLADGTIANPGVLEFTKNVSLRIKDQVTIGNSTVVNPAAGVNAVFYIGSSGPSYEFRVKPGGPVRVNASVYAPYGNIIVEGNANYNTFMNGTYIAESIASNDKNIYWNFCPILAGPIFKDGEIKPLDIQNEHTLLVYPNPSSGEITINFKLDEGATAILNIYSSAGQLVQKVFEGYVESDKSMTITVESNLAEGLYFLQLKSGGKVDIVRLIIFN